MSDNIIQINNMNKWFGDFQVLKGINLEVKPKQKIVVCGPSGSGKSTLIRCINRLEEHQEGDIIVDGNELSEKTKDIEKKVANLISQGNCVGWFQGKAEYGPRSLGARSILADPRKKSSKSRINQLLKKRELLSNQLKLLTAKDYKVEEVFSLNKKMDLNDKN